jgi:hypothetical protein
MHTYVEEGDMYYYSKCGTLYPYPYLSDSTQYENGTNCLRAWDRLSKMKWSSGKAEQGNHIFPDHLPPRVSLYDGPLPKGLKVQLPLEGTSYNSEALNFSIAAPQGTKNFTLYVTTDKASSTNTVNIDSNPKWIKYSGSGGTLINWTFGTYAVSNTYTRQAGIFCDNYLPATYPNINPLNHHPEIPLLDTDTYYVLCKYKGAWIDCREVFVMYYARVGYSTDLPELRSPGTILQCPFDIGTQCTEITKSPTCTNILAWDITGKFISEIKPDANGIYRPVANQQYVACSSAANLTTMSQTDGYTKANLEPFTFKTVPCFCIVPTTSDPATSKCPFDKKDPNTFIEITPSAGCESLHSWYPTTNYYYNGQYAGEIIK